MKRTRPSRATTTRAKAAAAEPTRFLARSRRAARRDTASQGRWNAGDRARRHPLGVEPRESVLSPRAHHEGGPDALLRASRELDPSDHARPPARSEAIPQWHRRRVVLSAEGAGARAAGRSRRDNPERAGRAAAALHWRRPRNAALHDSARCDIGRSVAFPRAEAGARGLHDPRSRSRPQGTVLARDRGCHSRARGARLARRSMRWQKRRARPDCTSFSHSNRACRTTLPYSPRRSSQPASLRARRALPRSNDRSPPALRVRSTLTICKTSAERPSLARTRCARAPVRPCRLRSSGASWMPRWILERSRSRRFPIAWRDSATSGRAR